MIVDELILKLQADLADVKKGLAQVKVDAEKTGKEAGANMGKAAGTSFGDVFQAVAGAAVLNAVNSFYGKAAQAFNKFEAAFLRADSIARAFGQSIDDSRKRVQDLADKGFLNLNQAASSFANATALGFNTKQASEFIEKLSDIAAFQNTIGDGAEAVASGIAGIGVSTEKVENIGVPVKLLNQQYQENLKTMTRVAAAEKFLQGVRKESAKFTGDAARAVDTLQGAQNKANAATDKAMVAIGKGLEPTLKKFYNTIEDGAKWFAKWFESMDSGTKTILIFIPILSALTVALAALVPVLKAISLANPFGWVAAAIALFGSLIAISNEFINKSKPENLVKSYKEVQKELETLGSRIQALQSMNKRTIEQEQELINSKKKLREEAKALGLDYDALIAKLKDFNKVSEEVSKARRDQTAKDIDKARTVNADNLRDLDARIERTRKFYDAQGIKFDATSNLPTIDPSGLQNPSSSISAVLKAREATANKSASDDLARASLFADESQAGEKAAAELAEGKATEARFIESQNKLLEIEKNRLFTIGRLGKKLKDEEAEQERQRRIAAANQDAEFQRESVRSDLKQTIAEYIEDKRSADINALEEQTRNAKRASEEQLSYELVLAKKNQKEIARAKLENAKRLADIDKANAIKQGVIEAEAMARTAQAAQASVSGFSQIAKARDVGGFFGGIGGLSQGLSGLSPTLKALGPAGQALGALGGIASTLSGLFGKSDEERAREAAEAQRVREEQLKILELQANYQKSMLALQEAAAKLPFENLQRQLRLIDIESQQAVLRGGDANAIENTRLQRRQSAIQSTLTSQSGAIAGGQLFGGTGSSPDELIGFLSERGAQSLAVQQFVALFSSLSTDVINRGIGDQQIAQLQSYRGKVPAELMAVLDDYVSKRNALISQVEDTRAGLRVGLSNFDESTRNQLVADAFNPRATNILSGSLSGVNSLSSEITADTGVAENLLSTLEQSLANQKQIQDNTKKTADNTAKALELRPDRERSFIDVGLGFIQSLGQRISPSAIGIAQGIARQNLTLPTSIGTATATSSLARTLQERMADAMEIQVAQGERANQLLDGILRATIELYRVMDGNPGTVSTFDDAAATAYLADRKRRAY